jgi:hypothetical protein
VNPNPQSISVLAEQRRTELMADAAQHRLARVATASSGKPSLTWPVRFSRRPSPWQASARIAWVGRLPRPGRPRPADTARAA